MILCKRGRHRALGLVIASALALAGCAGSGSAVGNAPGSALGRAVVAIAIPQGSAQSVRRAAYISPATKSVAIVVNALAPVTFNVGASQPNCTTTAATITCSLAVAAPVGTATFSITLYDQANATGNVLSTASAQAQIVAGQSFTINANALGQPATLQLIITPTTTINQVTITARAIDADGNAISGTYQTPVAVSVSGSLPVTLSASTIPDATTTITASYVPNAAATATITASVGSATSTALLPLSSFRSITLPTTMTNIAFGATGTNNDVWFGELGPTVLLDPASNLVGGSNSRVVRLTTDDTVTEYPLPYPSGSFSGITAGPDGAMWFTQPEANIVGSITTSGAIRQFPAPSPSARPRTPFVGPDGAIWFSELPARKLGRITISGQTSEVTLGAKGTATRPSSAAIGPDGNFWVAIVDDNIARVTLAGALTLFPTLTNTSPRFIALGSDGNLWFSEEGLVSVLGDSSQAPAAISRITPAGAITRFQLPFENSEADQIALGHDGNIYFSDFYGAVGHITPSGTIDEWPTGPFGLSYSNGLAIFPDGSIASGDPFQDKIEHFTPAAGWLAIPLALNVNTNNPAFPSIVGLMETGNGGPYSVRIADTTIATVTLVPGMTKTWQVTGIAAGSTALGISDSHGRFQFIPVSVTTTSGVLQSHSRAKGRL